jgi:hypothetical protein
MQYVRIKKGLNLKKLLIDQMDIDDLLVITSSLQEVFTLYKELNGQRDNGVFQTAQVTSDVVFNRLEVVYVVSRP